MKKKKYEKEKQERGEFDLFDELPACPEHVTGHGAEIWESIGKNMVFKKQLGPKDMVTFETYCMTYNNFRQAMEAIEKHGVIIEIEDGPIPIKKNPACTIAIAARADLLKYAKVLGLTPDLTPTRSIYG